VPPPRISRRRILALPALAAVSLTGCAPGGPVAADDGGRLGPSAATGPAPAGSTPVAPPAAGDPVRLTGTRSSAGWIVQFHLREPAREIWYRRPTDPDWISTGSAYGQLSAQSGEPLPKAYAVLADLSGRVMFAVRYVDNAGETKGPFEVEFDSVRHAVESVRSVLADIPQWVAFRDHDGRRLVYFTTLLVYKYALSEIRFGFDGDPTRSLRFTPSDALGIADTDEMFLEVPPGTRACHVELVFRDGSRSGVRRFET
jgi:hypothetical protein